MLESRQLLITQVVSQHDVVEVQTQENQMQERQVAFLTKQHSRRTIAAWFQALRTQAMQVS